MEEIGRQNLDSPPPLPPLLFYQSIDFEKIVLSSIGDPKNRLDIKSTPAELLCKGIQSYSNGWFILLDNESNQNSMNYSLWNPLTSEFICLPPLTLKSEQEINGCILSSAPNNPNCMLILFEKKGPSIFRTCVRSNHWHHHLIYEVYGFLDTFVMCNGTLYCGTFSSAKLVKIDLNMPRLVVNVFNECISDCLRLRGDMYIDYMVESCGELFLVYLVEREPYSVISVKVFKLDLLNMAWRKVESINGRAFFLSSKSSFSCFAHEPEVKGNHVYFTLFRQKCIYAFNMEDKSVSISLPCANPRLWISPMIWIMQDLRPRNTQKQFEDDLHVERNAITPTMVKQVEGNFGKLTLDSLFVVGKRFTPQALVNFRTFYMSFEFVVECLKECKTLISWRKDEGNFGKLPLDVLFAIGKCLMPQDFMNFRAVSTSSRLAVECLKERKTLIPWLMVWEKGNSICNFVDLWGERYPMNIHSPQLKGASMSCSKEGWCLMLQEKYSVFLWNPFVSKVIQLPSSPHERKSYTSFSSSIDHVVLMGYSCGYSVIDYIFLKEGVWYSLTCPNQTMRYNTLTFCNGTFYLLNEDIQLFSFKRGIGFKCVNSAIEPSLDYIQYFPFLVECDGNLLSVFVSYMGGSFQIFRLCDRDMVWVEVMSLGNHTLYISRCSSLSTIATSGMANRVYLPRFYGKSAIYYSLESKKLHTHCTDNEVLESFYDTKEQLDCSWILPKLIL